ncbi:MAG TPA: histidine phosphatase family protein [Sphingomicrobium sp.]|nr:histidine phosphatase family protein [Sphingomicrobium sp.]
MKTLTLLRHAKAERESPGGGDFDRALSARGRENSIRMGQEMRRLGLHFDRVLASPARRVVETVEGVGELLPQYDERIYDASTGQLFDVIGSVDDGVGKLLIIGHNPGLERLAAKLTAGEIQEFPTAALAEIELPIEHWRDIKEASGRLVHLLTPKTLD